MTEWVEQWICTKLCVKGEHSPTETTGMIQKAAATGTWWLAASSWQYACPFIISCVEFFGKTSNCPGDSAPQQPRFGTLLLTVFPKTKITFEREEISGHWWDSGKYNGAADGRTVWGPEVPTLKGTEASLCYVQCFLCLVSSSKMSLFSSLHGRILSGQTLYVYMHKQTYVFSSGICFCSELGDIQQVFLEWRHCHNMKAMHLPMPALGADSQLALPCWPCVSIRRPSPGSPTSEPGSVRSSQQWWAWENGILTV